MMMNFHGSTKKKRTGRRIVVVLIVLLILLNAFDVLWPHTTVRSLLLPVRVVREWIATPFVFMGTAFKDKEVLVSENQMLKAKITELELRELQQQVQNSLSASLVAEQTYATQGVVVPVLVRPPYSPYDTLVLDVRGRSVALGGKVFALGVFIGEVTQIDALTAVVTLHTSPGTKTVVRVGSTDAEAVGQGGGRYIITVPKDAVVAPGDAVIAPQVFNAILGIVGAVDPDASGTFQDVHMSLPVAFSSLEAVTITDPIAVLE